MTRDLTGGEINTLTALAEHTDRAIVLHWLAYFSSKFGTAAQLAGDNTTADRLAELARILSSAAYRIEALTPDAKEK